MDWEYYFVTVCW